MEDEQAEAGSTGSGATISPMRRPAASASTLSRDVQSKIGQHLRAMYDDVVRQGVPDRFMTLLSQLDDRRSAGTEDAAVDGKAEKRSRDEGMGR